MSARSILAFAASLVPLALAAPAPASAYSRGVPDGLLASLPAHAPPGVCYARVNLHAAFTPPGPSHARWRLRPGSPGPVWCLVTEPGAPPVQIRAERHGWLRVRCERPAPRVHVAVRRRPHPVAPHAPPPFAHEPCCNLAAGPPPPPVVTIVVPAPVPPRSPWLSWSNKSVY